MHGNKPFCCSIFIHIHLVVMTCLSSKPSSLVFISHHMNAVHITGTHKLEMSLTSKCVCWVHFCILYKALFFLLLEFQFDLLSKISLTAELSTSAMFFCHQSHDRFASISNNPAVSLRLHIANISLVPYAHNCNLKSMFMLQVYFHMLCSSQCQNAADLNCYSQTFCFCYSEGLQ